MSLCSVYKLSRNIRIAIKIKSYDQNVSTFFWTGLLLLETNVNGPRIAVKTYIVYIAVYAVNTHVCKNAEYTL